MKEYGCQHIDIRSSDSVQGFAKLLNFIDRILQMTYFCDANVVKRIKQKCILKLGSNGLNANATMTSPPNHRRIAMVGGNYKR